MRIQALPYLVLLGVMIGCTKAPAPDAASKTDSAKEVQGIAMAPSELFKKAEFPQYPGSDLPEGKSGITSAGSQTRYELHMTTTDSIQKVVDYYKSKLKVDQKGTAQAVDMLGMTPKGKLVQIKLGLSKGSTTIQAVVIDEK